MSHLIYNAAWRAARPFLKRRIARDESTRPMCDRFHPALPETLPNPVWVQACSVGEVNTALPLLAALQDIHGERGVLLTSSTVTGYARAGSAYRGPSAWFPFDHPASVRRFIDALNPRALVLVETELWPNVLRECERRGIPILVANARLSDKHYARYLRWRSLARPMFSALTAVGAQSETYAERFLQMGAAKPAVRVTGNLKYDAAPTALPTTQQRQRIRASCGIPEQATLLVFGSTRPGDEALASACWSTLREELPGLHLVIAPRHVDRADEIAACFGEPVLRRSALQSGAVPSGERVLLLDTLGELNAFYAVASLAVVGGSFYPGVEGHNPLEPAGLGVPPVFGPHMGNFIEPAATLVAADAAVQVACPEDLYGALSGLLRDTAELRQRGTRARRVVLDHQGAVARNVALLGECLERVAPG